MEELFINTGAYLADLIGAEDAQIVSFASAGIAQLVASLIGKGSAFHLYHPYSSRISQREVVFPKGHNIDYGAPRETMVELGGGKLVEAGYANTCSPDLVEDMITEDTVAIFYVKSHHTVQKSMLTVKEVVDIAHKYEIP